MLTSKTGRAFLRVIVLTAMLTALSCKKGNTDGGSGTRNAGPGNPFVSDGGAGATIELITPDTLSVGEIDGFRVFLRDPRGQAPQFVRIFCETEQGIAIIEPSRNGVAFENTDANGQMSGQVGGLTPGSYLMECRASEGFNLIARQTIIIEGPVPAGFTGFPGAAGGNLGGGRLVEDPGVADDPSGSPGITSIEFVDVNGTRTEVGFIDLVADPDCDGDPATIDPEPFGFDTLFITISNPQEEPLNIDTITFTVNDGSGVVSLTEFTGTQVAAGGSMGINILLTDFIPGGPKRWAGSGSAVISTTSSITVTVTGTLIDSGEGVTLTDSATYTADNIDEC